MSELEERLEAALPPPVVEGTLRWMRAVEGALGRGLRSAVLYGSVLRSGYVPLVSDLNVLLVTDTLGIEQLRAIAEPSKAARREVRLAPMLLTEEDLARSTDVLPLLFLEIQENHVQLLGDDLLSGLVIRRDHMRLACELMARNMVMRLRQTYLLRGTLRSALVEALHELAEPFSRLLHNVMELDGGTASDEPAEIFAQASGELGLDEATLTTLWSTRLGADPPDRAAVERLYEDFMNAASKVADYVDRIADDQAN